MENFYVYNIAGFEIFKLSIKFAQNRLIELQIEILYVLFIKIKYC